MKLTKPLFAVLILALVLFASCGPNAIRNEVDAQIVAEAVVAALTPAINSNTLDPFGARAALLTGYTQPGGGTVSFVTIIDPEWDSQYPVPESDFDYTSRVTFVDFVVPLGTEEYTLNAVVTFNFAYINDELDRQFIFTVWGSAVTVSGGGIEDTFDLDFQAFIDIDITRNGNECSAAVSGSVSGVIAEVVVEISSWSYSFDFVDPL